MCAKALRKARVWKCGVIGSSAARPCESTCYGGPCGHQLLQAAEIDFGDFGERDAVTNCSLLELGFGGSG